ncbi:MAG: hydroxymethylbilane synthase [Treponema sp.]|jgi:hydroxymethylbilane synthase|nr:hydroxymethylbilane synthase [Treponema sp.]
MTPRREIRFGSRESDLAVIQARLVMDAIARRHPEISLRLVTMKTRGDLYPEIPLEDNGDPERNRGKTLFTGALEEALVRGAVDLCVHSLKDMAEKENPDLPIAALAKRGDPRDMLVLSQKGPVLRDLPRILSVLKAGSLPVGCGSARRRIQLLLRAPGLAVAPVRGNVPGRLAKMDGGAYGALILAAAGLERLGLADRPGYIFPVREMIPAAGQGVLAIQGRRGESCAFLDAVRDPVTEEEAGTERALIRALDGGCGSPAAAYARIEGNEISILGMYAADPGAPPVRDEIAGDRAEGLRLAETLARRLLRKDRNR